MIQRLETQASLGGFTDLELKQKVEESYRSAKAELIRLETRKKNTTQVALEDEERRSYKMLMQEVGDSWDEIVMPEEHPRLVYLFIKSVTLEHLSPLFFRVHIQWRDPSWDIDCGLCFKGGQTSLTWTEEEAAILQEHFATTPRSQLMQLLPRRGYQSMKNYVRDHHLGIRRQAKPEPGVPYLVSLEDWKIMEEHGISEQELISMRTAKLITWATHPFTPSHLPKP